MCQIHLQLFDLMRELEKHTGNDYTKTEIADGMNITRQTLHRLLTDEVTRLDYATICGVLTFFASEGMPIDIGDLFTVETDT